MKAVADPERTSTMAVAVHVTHEAIHKIGGIGAVVRGLICTANYQKIFPRTLLYTPLFDHQGPPEARLGEDSQVLYSGLDGYDAAEWRMRLAPVEEKYGVRAVYGRKRLFPQHGRAEGAEVDILAVDIWNVKSQAVADFTFQLWERFGIQSERFAHDRDYDQYVRIGAVLPHLFAGLYGPQERATLFAHEYMGMPSALAFELEKHKRRRQGDRTIFYAHEVSTVRTIVEGLPGHDVAFYNLLRADRDEGASLEDEFGSFAHFSRNELVKRAPRLDAIIAVSDVIKEELLYLCPQAEGSRIHVVPNGISVESATYAEKEEAQARLQDYCERLFSFRPDAVFTHVTRLVVSKGLWRDIHLLYHLDQEFVRQGKRGLYVLLSTLIGGGRDEAEVLRMEAEYGWPVLHQEGWPDLVGLEIETYRWLELFNARSAAIKGVFLNQFGFAPGRCGRRVPQGSSVRDLRVASDMEFGLSVYEPFGIAQVETLPYGGLPLISSACGCATLLEESLDPEDFLVLDFTRIPTKFSNAFQSKQDFKAMTRQMRDLIEAEVCRQGAPLIAQALPGQDRDRRRRYDRMQERAGELDWEHAASRIGTLLAKL
jgi:glycosyltransferase involved in cell wall biosynthesis